MQIVHVGPMEVYRYSSSDACMIFATQEEEEQHLNFDMGPISALIFHVAYKFNLQSQICIKVVSVQIYGLNGETEQVLLIDVCLRTCEHLLKG